jgi:hypothetical protein
MPEHNLTRLVRDYLQAFDSFQMGQAYALRAEMRQAVALSATRLTDHAEPAAVAHSASWTLTSTESAPCAASTESEPQLRISP